MNVVDLTNLQERSLSWWLQKYMSCLTIISVYLQAQKRTVHPVTGHKGPEGKYRYSSTISLTSALDGGEW